MAVDSISVCLCMVNGCELLLEDCPPEMLIWELKKRVHSEWKVEPGSQRLVLDAVELADLMQLANLPHRPADGKPLDICVILSEHPIQATRLHQLQQLVLRMRSEDKWSRQAAKTALKRVVDKNSPREVDEVLRMLQLEARNGRPCVARCIMEVLPCIAPEDHAGALEVAYCCFKSSDDFVRFAAAEAVLAISRPGNKAVVRQLCTFLNDSSACSVNDAIDDAIKLEANFLGYMLFEMRDFVSFKARTPSVPTSVMEAFHVDLIKFGLFQACWQSKRNRRRFLRTQNTSVSWCRFAGYDDEQANMWSVALHPLSGQDYVTILMHLKNIATVNCLG
eukprot:TRINITY_DN31771_c0_g1_i1.p1 TRINITY_DN31771_c0_g1~~TRINITY_DN31771_c0_g1_i1.p1  ORF type:complete len:335 (-),score=52.22 TRINITY_DN31771_c0_g1_i1:976-1980(-)